jgi:hypothetical protein
MGSIVGLPVLLLRKFSGKEARAGAKWGERVKGQVKS